MNKRAEPASIARADVATQPSQDRGAASAADAAKAEERLLVDRARRGEADAFRVLFERYRRKAFAHAYGIVRDKDEALDVLQDAFLKAYRHLPGFEGTSQFYTWLFRIVHNVAIDHLRRVGRSRKVEFDDAVQHDAEDAAGAGDGVLHPVPIGDPARELHRAEARAKLGIALAKLSPNHRAVLVMREVDDLSYEEMAEAMKCSKGTIMSRLFHARRYMHKHLSEAYGEAPIEGGWDASIAKGPQQDKLKDKAKSKDPK